MAHWLDDRRFANNPNKQCRNECSPSPLYSNEFGPNVAIAHLTISIGLQNESPCRHEGRQGGVQTLNVSTQWRSCAWIARLFASAARAGGTQEATVIARNL